jgi:tetratricopeptide (TPR) repeat protein
MRVSCTNLTPWALGLGLLILAGCAHAPPPAVGDGKGDEGPLPARDEAEEADMLLQTRPRDQYWWNFSREEIPTIQGGSYQDALDSLGFDAYRALDEEDQRDRRRLAKNRVKAGEKLGRGRAALDQYATAVGLCPYLNQAWLYYAEGVINLGNYNSGRYLLHGAERTLRFAGNEDDQRDAAAELYSLDAVASFNLNESERALSSIDNSLRLKPNNDEGRLLRARCLINLRRFVEARQELRFFEFGAPNYALAQSVLGVLEMEAGEYGKAEYAFNEAYEYGLRSGIMENDRGRLCLLQNDPEAAARHFERAVDLRPDLLEARNNLAVAYRRSGKEALAEEVLLQALRLNPDYAPAHFNLAEIYRDRLDRLSGAELEQTGRQALVHYDAALARDYRVSTILERRAWVELVMGNPTAAEADLLQLAGAADTDPRVLFLLARSKKDQEEYRIAEQLYRMALSRGYAEAELYSDLGEVQMRRGELEDARLSLEQALARDDGLVATRLNLCEVYHQLGDTADAQRVLAEAEALAPDDPAVAALRAKLGQP